MPGYFFQQLKSKFSLFKNNLKHLGISFKNKNSFLAKNDQIEKHLKSSIRSY